MSLHEAQYTGEAAPMSVEPATSSGALSGNNGAGRDSYRENVGGKVGPVNSPLLDTFGRIHDNLRISVTDRCNIRCFYCMPEDNVQYMAREEILSFEEIERFARVAASLGVTKLRVTGGEPLVRKDLPVLVRKLAGIPGITDLALTTNGVLLARDAEALYAAGLRRLNVHLDTLDRQRFERITSRDE